MFQSVRFLLLSSILFCCWSCGSSANTDTATSVEKEEKPAQTDVPAPTTQAVPMSGEQYEIVVLNDTIKSPRKEMRGKVDGVDVVINYGSPAANGRVLYGELVPYGKIWRTGANEAVRITTSAPMAFGTTETTTIPAGTYSLFTLPTDQDNWAYIFNKVADQWGAYDYDDAQDVARVKTTAVASDEFSERMDFTINDGQLQLHWGKLVVPISLKKAS